MNAVLSKNEKIADQALPLPPLLSYSSCFGRQGMSQLQECLAAEVLDGGSLRNREAVAALKSLQATNQK